MSQMGLAPLHQALRKAFQCVENSQKTWREVLRECDPLMVSLGNLAEQFVALSKVDLSKTPLKMFPDLEDKLRFKLHHAADTVMVKLHEKLSSLQSLRDAVSSQVASVFQIHHHAALDLAALTERSPAAPSVADMMQWLQDADRHFRREFIKRKTLLSTLRPDDFAQMESAPERWKSLNSPKAEDEITDALCRASFFTDER
ncbi:AFG2-interacting ribosome maturation factor-like [Eucyclogobius newberryi]|uniref:AFG2-interacting ribosome maturation factor n=1 Tax=Eucyclogobius newberryi TaxID=166745 RepID=UPI003B5B800F